MSKSIHPRIRFLLRQNDDGLTASQVSTHINSKPDTVRNALKNMADTYIDRWIYLRGMYTAVWCIVIPPEDCPKPER